MGVVCAAVANEGGVFIGRWGEGGMLLVVVVVVVVWWKLGVNLTT